MANEIGNALLTSLTKSSFDIGNMTKVLAEAEIAGPKAILESRQEKATTELDALKYLKGNLEAFNTYVTDLTSPSLFAQRAATSSNENVVSVTASSSAVQASYQIESRQLAQAHTLVFDTSFSSTSSTLSDGVFEFQVNGQTHTFNISAANNNNTLEGLQRAINNSDAGVSASIVNNGSGYQLMLNSNQTGAASQISLNSGVAELNGFTTTAEAQDAVMVMNGLTVTSSTNSFSNVIDGVTFQLHSSMIGSQQTVSVNQDTQGVADAVSSFVEVYNQLGTILKELGSYDKSDLSQAELESEEYRYYGDLAGNSILRSAKTQVEQSLRGVLDSLSGGAYQSLADIGLSIDSEGGLQFDSARLNEVMTADMSAVSNLFSRGGSSDDNLINVIGGNDRTQAGDYSLNIIQTATQATVSSTAATAAGGQRLASDKVTDMQAALTIAANASMTLNGVAYNIGNGSSDTTYATKEEVAAAMQTALSAAGVSVAYDGTQSRFEITSNAGTGALSITSTSGMSNQGFGAANYTGADLIDLSAAPVNFDVSIDGSTASTVSITADFYTGSELAKLMQDSINNNTDVQAANGSVAVAYDGAAFTVTSNRYGINSTLDFTNFSGMANAGFSDGSPAALAGAIGQNVDGTIATATGTLSIGAYVDSEDGRKVSISDYAVMSSGSEAEVRGLEFEVLGGISGTATDPLGEPRGTISFSQGFASQLEQTINDLFDADNGLISQRISGLDDRLDEYEEKTKTLDARYERILMKYQLQFSMLQSIMSSSEQTRNYLTATFSNKNNN